LPPCASAHWPAVKCPHLRVVAQERRVLAVGSIDAQLMFCGRGAGRGRKTNRAKPFVGKAGQLLTKIHPGDGSEPADVYIANIFEMPARHARPERRQPQSRPPTRWPRAFPYLHEQIDLIRPKVIMALGADGRWKDCWARPSASRKLRGTWKDLSRHAAHAERIIRRTCCATRP